jgi:beta-glucosidase
MIVHDRNPMLLLLARLGLSAAYPWQDPSLSFEARAENLVSLLTLEEKVDQMMNAAPGIPRLGIPPYEWWNEALHGVAYSGTATVFPQAIGLAATFDPAAVRATYGLVGDEARAKHERYVNRSEFGRHKGLTFWTPNVNIFRDPRWGRGQETFGEDPHLTSTIGAAAVEGLQGAPANGYVRLHACAKHFAVHSGPESERHRFDVRPTGRDLAQTYLPAFEALVRAGVSEVMCAYNRVNGRPACASDLLWGRLREWQFRGIVTSDCGAIDDFWVRGRHETHADAAAASADAVRHGTTIECGSQYRALTNATRRGLIAEAEITKAAAKLFAERFRLGMFDPPERVPFRLMDYAVVQSPANANHALAVAQRSIVLLQNDGTLPLRDDQRILVVGPNADSRDMQWGNYNGFNWAATVSIFEGIRAAAPSAKFLEGCDLTAQTYLLDAWENVSCGGGKRGYDAQFWPNPTFAGQPTAAGQFERIRWHDGGEASLAGAFPASNYSARFTGSLNVAAAETLLVRLRWRNNVRVRIGEPGKEVFAFEGSHPVGTRSFNLTVSRPVNFSAGAFPIVVEYVHFTGEAVLFFAVGRQQPVDVPGLAAAASASDVVVFVGGITAGLEGEEMDVYEEGFAGGDRTLIELPKVQMEVLEVLKAAGKPVVFVLCAGGAVAFDPTRVNAAVDAFYPGQAGGTAVADVLFGKYNPAGRLPVTFYRRTQDLPAFGDYNMAGHTYRYFNGEVLYPFGHGLSYTTFAYERLSVPANASLNSTVEVTFDLRNTGAKGGDEVAQVYVKANRAGEPVKALKWFQRRFVAQGAVAPMTANLSAADFTVFNETTGAVEVVPGTFTVCVGGSSAEAALTCRNLTLGESQREKKPALAVMISVIAVAGAAIIGVVVAVVLCWKRTPDGVERL